MRISHVFLAILVALIWGLNFIFVTLCFNDFPPYLLCALRFLLASVPLIFFIKKPKVPFYLLFSYGMLTFGLHFSFLFAGMYAGMQPGLTSLLLQVQLFFSVLFAAIFLKERPKPMQLVGGVLAFLGIGIIWLKLEGTAPLIAFIYVIAAAAAWGLGNLISRKIGQVSALGLVSWGCLIAFFPVTLISFWLEGPDAILTSLSQITWVSVLSLFFIVYMSTWVGYGIWSWLLGRYPVGTVVPFALLAPLFSLLASALFLNESMPQWKITAAWLILGGVIINLFGERLIQRFTKKIAAIVE